MEQAVFNINFNKLVLSSEIKVLKTSFFMKKTEGVLMVDSFLLKLAETIMLNIKEIKPKDGNIYICRLLNLNVEFLYVETLNGENNTAIIFTNLLTIEKKLLTDENYLIQNFKKDSAIDVKISLKQTNEVLNGLKLYNVFDTDYVNFPLLSAKQQEIVVNESDNIIVQGVAGSGKTNVCASKIIYSACKGYLGKVLYSTFSKSLLLDMREKIETFKYNLKTFLSLYKNNSIEFLDSNHKKAVENRLNIEFSFDADEDIIKKIERIITFLDNNVQFLLLEDLYKNITKKEVNLASEKFFTENYVKNIKNYQLLTRLEKIKHLSNEVIYKEIYGVLFGTETNKHKQILSLEEYVSKREESFSKQECESIYAVGKDYLQYLKENNMLDSNLISRELLSLNQKINKYSLVILDEVQDFTQINLVLFKSIARKMFCVGDALQMINPSFFSFAYLKNLMYEKDISSVAKLKSNYRNTKQIQQLIEKLGEINTKLFGKHNFVVSGKSVGQTEKSSCITIKNNNFVNKIKDKNFIGLTIIVANNKEKQELKQKLDKYEILTVAEIKGLERDNVLLYNLLSTSSEKWNYLSRKAVNKKQADENSVFRYYFNLFYVGLSRTRKNIFIIEDEKLELFESFFNNNFESKTEGETIALLENTVSMLKLEDKDIVNKANEFLYLSQLENAKFLINKISNIKQKQQMQQKVLVFENYVLQGKHQEAGLMLWKLGYSEDAKRQFLLSGNDALVDLVNASSGVNNNLSMDIVSYYPMFQDDEMVSSLIQQMVLNDIDEFETRQKGIDKRFGKSNK